MKKTLLTVFILMMTASAFSQNTVVPSTRVKGTFFENEREVLVSTYIASVYRWLRRYNPIVVTQSENYVEMSAKYDYQLKIEFTVNESNPEYDIVVTVAQNRFNQKKAHDICNRIATGIQREFTNTLARRER
jgi:hypothetical protein